MQNEETKNEETKKQDTFNEAYKSYRNFRIKGLIFYLISFIALLIAIFAPSIKVSGQDYYTNYAYAIRSLYIDYESGKEIDFEEMQNGEVRLEANLFVISLMVGDEDDADEEKSTLAVLLLASTLDAPHFMQLCELNSSEFETAVANESKVFASLSHTYSMYEMGKLIGKESCFYKLFGGEKKDVLIFYSDTASAYGTLIPYIFTALTLIIEAFYVVWFAVQIICSKNVVESACNRKFDTKNKTNELNSCKNFKTAGLVFYISLIICRLITKSKSILKNPRALIYKSITLSPLIYIMLGIEVVALVLSFLNRANARDASLKLSKLYDANKT